MSRYPADNVACEWLVTYPPSMRQRRTNFCYTRQEAEAKFGVGWCEPVRRTETIRGPQVNLNPDRKRE